MLFKLTARRSAALMRVHVFQFKKRLGNLYGEATQTPKVLRSRK